MRLGIFGGSFDPVHNAHLALARACQQQAALDEIWFTPAAMQPLKQTGPHATNDERRAMLELAVGDEPSWRVCTMELDRGGVSYTVDTLRAIHAQRPNDQLFFLIGADALADVPHWNQPAEIFRLATALVVRRAGDRALDLSSLARLCPAANPPLPISMPALDISSTEIRRRIWSGEAIDELVPQAVVEFILAHNLYR
ncbi:MAG: nicotinate-nucleotide adenylyltransferase [Pirellulales bacterium]